MEPSETEEEGPGESVQSKESGDRGISNELHREQSRRGVREVKGEARGTSQWRKAEIDGQVEGESKGRRSAERKIQEIDGHGTEVTREERGRGNLMRAT